MTLRKWYWDTGCPVLLNTSLNIKGQPLLNDEIDIIKWESMYNFKVLK
jgi:carbamoyltransferase